MKNIIITIIFLLAFLPANEIYKQVRIYSDTEETLSILQTSGLDIDHSFRSLVNGLSLPYLKAVFIYWMKLSSIMISSMKI